MASEKKPSIYQDRGTIGSAKDLDEYGVWVKSEPQDLAGDDKNAAAGDFFLDSLDKLPDFPTDLDASSGADSGSAGSDFSIPEDEFNLESGEGTSALSLGGGRPAGDGTAISPEGDDSITGFSLDDEDLDFSLPGAAAEEALSKDGGIESPSSQNEDKGFNEISLEDLLDVSDDFPGEAVGEEEGDGEKGDADENPSRDSADKSTRLLMKIADELSSIRAELSALKLEFSAAREAGGGNGEPRGFFNDAGTDDKIALTGDELNNILNTAEFTEESGENAAKEGLFPGVSGEGAAPAGVSPGTETPEAEAPGEAPVGELSLDDLDIAEAPAAEAPDEAPIGELSLDDLDIAEAPAVDSSDEAPVGELSLDDLDIAEAPAAEAPDETPVGELSLDDLDIGGAPEAEAPDEAPVGEFSLDDLDIGGASLEDLELPALAEEPVETGAGLPDELGAESPDDSELSLADLSDDSFNMDFSLEDSPAQNDAPADREVILEEGPEEGTEDSGDPEISLDTPFSDEEISLENFEGDALDLSGAVIEEPDLGAEISENPVQEPSDIDVIEDIAAFDEGFGEDGGGLSPETPSSDALEEPELPPLEEIDDGAELAGTGEGALDISPAGETGFRGEDLDQIIPEGFVAGEPDDEGDAGFGGLEGGISEEGISLDEIPEAEAAEADDGAGKTAGAGAPDEADLPALPGNFKTELKQVLSYMDQLLESLPEEKIEEFAKSEYFDTYKKLFKELGLA